MNKIKIKYIFKDDYNPIYINGAQGGINPQGEIIINFYLERTPIPVSQTFNVEENIISPNEIDCEPKDLRDSFVRVIESGVVMNYQTAKELHSWIGKHIESLESLQNDKKPQE